ncbi:MAG: type I-MYXAN CRISPR-associated protein Cas5/Cmx5/DevS [Candidatus Goldbacteria bacterium]|nr:type I-MYXAN CRISPR-associated protein Cas5/Cmx5/DevS [Candidatus Goldiibacteriota bacterium]
MNTIRLYVEVPIASFRVSQAREYWETYLYPPPATVYGMLLSMVGEENRLIHQGAEIAIAILTKPEISVVLRSLWRIKDKNKDPGVGNNKKPDFQELLSNIQVSVWIKKGKTEKPKISLMERVKQAFENPGEIKRFGGLSLGESTHLVNEIRIWKETDPKKVGLLVKDTKGDLTLPVWVDHVGSKGTRWEQFKINEDWEGTEPHVNAWVDINMEVVNGR